MAKPNKLNVREHLMHLQVILEMKDKYGDCPMAQEELRRIIIINKLILAKHERSREGGNRKDIRIPVS